MFFIIGFLLVFGSVIGGYMALGGHLDVLWQPFEFVIIGGGAIGAFVIANPKRIIGGVAAMPTHTSDWGPCTAFWGPMKRRKGPMSGR